MVSASKPWLACVNWMTLGTKKNVPLKHRGQIQTGPPQDPWREICLSSPQHDLWDAIATVKVMFSWKWFTVASSKQACHPNLLSAGGSYYGPLSKPWHMSCVGPTSLVWFRTQWYANGCLLKILEAPKFTYLYFKYIQIQPFSPYQAGYQMISGRGFNINCPPGPESRTMMAREDEDQTGHETWW